MKLRIVKNGLNQFFIEGKMFFSWSRLEIGYGPNWYSSLEEAQEAIDRKIAKNTQTVVWEGEWEGEWK